MHRTGKGKLRKVLQCVKTGWKLNLEVKTEVKGRVCRIGEYDRLRVGQIEIYLEGKAVTSRILHYTIPHEAKETYGLEQPAHISTRATLTIHHLAVKKKLPTGKFNQPYRQLLQDAKSCMDHAVAAFMAQKHPNLEVTPEFFDEFSKVAKRWVKGVVTERCEQYRVEWWTKAQRKDSANVAASSGLSCNTFALSSGKPMSRAQTTILLQLRTGSIGLRANLNKLKQNDSPTCSCGFGREDVIHVLLHCPDLEKARIFLFDKVLGMSPTQNLTVLLSTPDRAPLTALWSLVYLGIDQFEPSREDHLALLLKAVEKREKSKNKYRWNDGT